MLRLFWLLLLCACVQDSASRNSRADTICHDAARVGALPAELDEASGVAISRRHPGILWAHNDSGEPYLFAIDTTGRLRARIELDLPNRDWEDIAVGPCPQGDCIYVGAIGDNRQDRTDREIFRLPEPGLDAQHARVADRFRYRFPGDAHDAEAFFVMPTGELYLITKGRSASITLYRLPAAAAADSVHVLEPVQTLSDGLVQLPDMVTGAAATPDGGVVAIRTYSALQLYRFDTGQLIPIKAQSGFDLQELNEPQGEGIDISADGVVFLVSESGLEQGVAPLSRVQCAELLR